MTQRHYMLWCVRFMPQQIDSPFCQISLREPDYFRDKIDATQSNSTKSHMIQRSTWVAIGLFGVVLLLGAIGAFASHEGTSKLAPLSPLNPIDSTNIVFSLQTTSRLLLIDRWNYAVDAKIGTSRTNFSYPTWFTSTCSATPRNPHIFTVSVPEDVTEFQVSVDCYQGSALRAKLIDAFTDDKGMLKDNWVCHNLGNLTLFLEPNWPMKEVRSGVFVRTDAGWIERK
jgi:hypothetical protein